MTLDVGTTTINSLTLGGASNGFTSELTDGGITQTLNITTFLTVGQTGQLILSGASTVTAGNHQQRRRLCGPSDAEPDQPAGGITDGGLDSDYRELHRRSQ